MRSATQHRCVVLLVEDEPELREVLRVTLEADNYEVVAASNGRDALRTLRSTPRTCFIVLDLVLPVLDGRQFRALQLRDRSLAWIPVIVVSGGVDAAKEAREIGAQAFVRKPLDVDDLRGALARVGCLNTQRPDQGGFARRDRDVRA